MKKTRSQKILVASWFLFSILNILCFLYRDRVGNYTKYVSYNDLYGPDQGSPAPLKKWNKHLTQYTENEKKTGHQQTAAMAGVKKGDPSLAKLEKISIWLVKSLENNTAGRPSAAFHRLPVYEKYKEAIQHKTPRWCGVYGNLLQFYCGVNDIPCRYIESSGGIDKHILNECYISELKKWILVDLTNNVVYCQDQQGNYLNAADIMVQFNNKTTSNLKLFQTVGATVVARPFAELAGRWKDHLTPKNFFTYYYLTDPGQVYTRGQKIMRYFLPVTWYEVYQTKRHDNYQYYIRTGLWIVWLAITGLMLHQQLFKLRHDRS